MVRGSWENGNARFTQRPRAKNVNKFAQDLSTQGSHFHLLPNFNESHSNADSHLALFSLNSQTTVALAIDGARTATTERIQEAVGDTHEAVGDTGKAVGDIVKAVTERSLKVGNNPHEKWLAHVRQ